MNIFGKLVHIFMKLVHILGEVCAYFRLETRFQNFKQVREICGHYGNRGLRMILTYVLLRVEVSGLSNVSL